MCLDIARQSSLDIAEAWRLSGFFHKRIESKTMASGFLYILANSSMPDLIKVGKTTRDPTERVKELSSATGVPNPFLLVYCQPVEDCDAAEKWAHVELERRGYRPNTEREFFKAPVCEAVEILNAAKSIIALCDNITSQHLDTEQKSQDRERLSDELFDMGMDYLDGTDSLLSDQRKALSLFEQAAAIGHASAAFFAGTIYNWGGEGVKKNLPKSLEYHQRASSGGIWSSFALIAGIFEEAGQRSSAEKHWILFFEASIDALKTNDKHEWREYVMTQVEIYGFPYCLAASENRISSVVSPEKLKIFEKALLKGYESRIASESDAALCAFYRRGLTFLQEQLS
jgi:hypothetical protein